MSNHRRCQKSLFQNPWRESHHADPHPKRCWRFRRGAISGVFAHDFAPLLLKFRSSELDTLSRAATREPEQAFLGSRRHSTSVGVNRILHLSPTRLCPLIWLAAFETRSPEQSCSSLSVRRAPLLLFFLQSSCHVRGSPNNAPRSTRGEHTLGLWSERPPIPESDTHHTRPTAFTQTSTLVKTPAWSQQLRSCSCAGARLMPQPDSLLPPFRPSPLPGRFWGPGPGIRKVKSERVDSRWGQETGPLRLGGALRAEPMWVQILKPYPLIPSEARGAAHIPLPNTPGAAPPSHSCVGYTWAGPPAVTAALVLVTPLRPNSNGLCCTPTSSALNPSRSPPLSHLRVLTLHVAGQHLMCTSLVGKQALGVPWHDIDPPPSPSCFYPSFLQTPPVNGSSRVSSVQCPLLRKIVFRDAQPVEFVRPAQLSAPRFALRDTRTRFLPFTLFPSVHDDPTVTSSGSR